MKCDLGCQVILFQLFLLDDVSPMTETLSYWYKLLAVILCAFKMRLSLFDSYIFSPLLLRI